MVNRAQMPLPRSLSSIASLSKGRGSDSLPALLPLLVSAGLVVLLAWQLVQLTWTLIGASGTTSEPAASPSTQSGPGAAAASTAVDIQAIVNAHLFGVAGDTGPTETDPTEVATTRMNLVLAGTIANIDPKLGYAIIGESSSSSKVYSVGKTVTGGTTLDAVYPDRVILNRGGKLEALLLPKQFKGGGAPPPVARNLRGGEGSSGVGDQLRTMAQENPEAITQILRPQPVFANGQQRGYRVYPGRNRQQFAKLGLRPGDLVTAINGMPLDDPSRGMEVMESMNSATEVTVTVERNGQSTQITINNAELAADAAAAAAAPEAVPVETMPVQPESEESTE
jgi:general secretion pathway protein C